MDRRQFLAGILFSSGLMLTSQIRLPMRWKSQSDQAIRSEHVRGLIAGPQVIEVMEIDRSIQALAEAMEAQNGALREALRIPRHLLGGAETYEAWRERYLSDEHWETET